MRSLDLFSGIGGITHALRGLGIDPVLYVEIEKNAKDVLNARMKSGDLPKAPIHNDVRTLTAQDVGQEGIDIIVAGFPCTGFSTSGNMTGLNHPQSGLFSEIVRLTKELNPSYLFFENVAAIRTLGLKDVTTAMQTLGYHCWWVTVPAYIIGAPQHRRRWYCLCVKNDAPAAVLRPTSGDTWNLFDWSVEKVPRMWTDRAHLTESRRRASLLGYSVVPDAVRLAFLLCWTGLRGPVPGIFFEKEWKLTFPIPSGPSNPTAPSTAGALLLGDQVIMTVKEPKGISSENPAPSSNILLVPDAFTTTKRNPNQTAPMLLKPALLKAWASPRGTMMQASSVLTARTQRDLPTQLRFEQGTPDALRGGFPNPDWIDTLMGFPTGWTKA